MTDTEEFRPDLVAPLLRELAAAGATAELPVRGTSMRPILRDGDRVRVVPVTAADVRTGDVVVLAGSSGPVIHRLVGWWPARGAWRVLTKGDGAPRLDPPLRPDELAGRVVARVRDGRVRRLDGAGMRICGRCRAAVSLAAGLFLEAADRARRRARPGRLLAVALLCFVGGAPFCLPANGAAAAEQHGTSVAAIPPPHSRTVLSGPNERVFL